MRERSEGQSAIPTEVKVASALNQLDEAKRIAPGTTYHESAMKTLLDVLAGKGGLDALDRLQRGSK